MELADAKNLASKLRQEFKDRGVSARATNLGALQYVGHMGYAVVATIRYGRVFMPANGSYKKDMKLMGSCIGRTPDMFMLHSSVSQAPGHRDTVSGSYLVCKWI